ncbi:prepilin-type N-terminal cleavage/methylation domain-containing protein [Thaumasiovibrio sp. DFM-14]|uniref:prepilin-type N-terminal cleavage/methylation domain-containing protein n=1 Tax=Thaumasiovibrio sp. DFM-14 TaxID=3384792 RepID=UPI00399F5E77
MKRQGGFTLIELVVVIVVLGILAVTAAPRFFNLQGDARNAALKGLEGAVKSGANIVYAKAAIEGKEVGDADLDINGVPVKTKFGYPEATENGITQVIEGFEADWAIVSGSVATGSIKLTLKEFGADDTTSCFLIYSEALSAVSAASAVVDPDACKS